MQANHYEIQRMAQQIFMLSVIEHQKRHDGYQAHALAQIAIEDSQDFFKIHDQIMRESAQEID